MKTYCLVIAEAAEADLDRIADYISCELKEPITALKQLERIEAAMMALEELPERHSLVQDKYLAAKGMRKLPIDNYLLFYTVNKSKNTINIVRVLHGRRDWESIV
ncbi:type II toxin-antitoxin system RelE/ParE family toxin [Phosphitispora fastidiosa]|uniref:type II toxin-antitoxin system RelE/ParE family toxin n=1 Tax=Phosphitispora fastidiosa TaxID=2837202 RepID=UPI001E5EC528|nr:type II toxin-antitoxin system RelE/ParE family toxin [Phosphitispora fastidiosa]MBU7007868.1 toxin ParE1/3/4 [Phosphitispora fastidiosa]